MKKIISLILVFSFVGALAACAAQPGKPDNSADDQRARAGKAQGELSSEVKK